MVRATVIMFLSCSNLNREETNLAMATPILEICHDESIISQLTNVDVDKPSKKRHRETDGLKNNTPESYLFKPDVQKFPHFWKFIYLVSNEESCSVPKRNRTCKDASSAYCSVCDLRFKFSHKNPKTIKTHLQKAHSLYLTSHDSKVEAVEKKASAAKISSYYSSTKNLLSCTPEDQLKREILLARWIARILRPTTIVKDEEFCDFCHYLNNLRKEFDDMSRNMIRSKIIGYGKLVREKVKAFIKENVTFFSCTSDIWSSRNNEPYLSLTLHALTPEFEKVDLTLAILYMPESHTEDNIKERFEELFDEWGLSKDRITLMLRDNGSNIAKACEE